MDFRLSDERVRFHESVRGFAERHVKDGALERAPEPGFPWDIARLADHGVREAEINPLIVKAEGDGVVAVDGLVIRAEGEG